MDSTELAKRLAVLDTCAVSDALDSIGVNGTVTGLVRRSTSGTIAGRIQTVKLSIGITPGGSSTHLGSRSIEDAREKDIIVVEQRSGIDAAGWGGVLAVAAKAKGIQGVIIEGPARDIDEYQKIGFPVFSRSTTPRTARGRIHESGLNVEIKIGDVNVSAGDLVIADGTGVVFVPIRIAEVVIKKAEKIIALEKSMCESVLTGQPITEVMGKDYETLLETRN